MRTTGSRRHADHVTNAPQFTRATLIKLRNSSPQEHPASPRHARQPPAADLSRSRHDLRLQPSQSPMPDTQRSRRSARHCRPRRLPPRLPQHRLHRPRHRPTTRQRRRHPPTHRRIPSPLTTPPTRTSRTSTPVTDHQHPRPPGSPMNRTASTSWPHTETDPQRRHPRRRRSPSSRRTQAIQRQPLHRPARSRSQRHILGRRTKTHRPTRPLPTASRPRKEGRGSIPSQPGPTHRPPERPRCAKGALRRTRTPATDLRHRDQRTDFAKRGPARPKRLHRNNSHTDWPPPSTPPGVLNNNGSSPSQGRKRRRGPYAFRDSPPALLITPKSLRGGPVAIAQQPLVELARRKSGQFGLEVD